MSYRMVAETVGCVGLRGVDAGYLKMVLIDIVIAIIIVAVAAVLGLVVHPVLWVIVIAAALWLFARRGRW